MEDKKVKGFLELAKKSGKIKDVKEAFIDYPVENEWHKGKIENVLELSDNNQEYLIYKISNEQILFKIGEVDIDKVEEYKKSFYEELNEKD